MESVSIIGLDLAKGIFQAHGSDAVHLVCCADSPVEAQLPLPQPCIAPPFSIALPTLD
jgi:hypothetical protein